MEVSVIIPMYNREKYIIQCIQSALDQPEVKEVIVVDDGSTDDSQEIVNKMSASHPRIKMFQHRSCVRKGISESRNLGISKATKKYVAFLDSDDFYLPHRFELDSQQFEKHPDADGIYSNVENFPDPEGVSKSLAKKVQQDFPNLSNLFIPPESLLKILMLRRQGYIHLNGLVIKRSELSKDFLFDIDLEQAEDTDFIIRLAARKRMYSNMSERVVAQRRYHSQNMIRDRKHAALNVYKMYKKWIKQKFFHVDCYWCRVRISYRYIKLHAKLIMGMKRLMFVRLFCIYYFPVFLIKEYKSFL